MERTFVMIKPDGVQRGLIGEIVSRFEAKGLKLAAARLEVLPEDRVVEQYREHMEKLFFPGLAAYIMSGPCFLMAWEGKDAVAVVRRMVGATNPAEAAPGSIRGDFGLDIGRNRRIPVAEHIFLESRYCLEGVGGHLKSARGAVKPVHRCSRIARVDRPSPKTRRPVWWRAFCGNCPLEAVFGHVDRISAGQTGN